MTAKKKKTPKPVEAEEITPGEGTMPYLLGLHYRDHFYGCCTDRVKIIAECESLERAELEGNREAIERTKDVHIFRRIGKCIHQPHAHFVSVYDLKCHEHD